MDLSDISIIKLLPPNLARDKNIAMLCEAFDRELRRIISDIPGIAIIPNLVLKKITDNLLLDLLAWQFHSDFYSTDFPIEKKQEIILKSLDWHTRKGTPSVVEEVVSTVFSRAKTEEWFEYNGLPYRFRIATEEEIPDTETIKKLTKTINSVKNTRSFLEKLTQLYDFFDSIEISDYDRKTVRKIDKDYATQVILRNGRVLRDGRTVLNTEVENIFRDGTFTRNGTRTRSRTFRVPAQGTIFPPLYRKSGIQDVFALGFFEGNYIDAHKSQVMRNGAFTRNGFLNRSGYTVYSANDVLVFDSITVRHKDTLTLTDKIATVIGVPAQDTINRNYKRDSKQVRNGVLRRSSNGIVDPFSANYEDPPFTDNLNIADPLVAGIRHHYFRNNTRTRNGSIQRKGMVFIPLE